MVGAIWVVSTAARTVPAWSWGLATSKATFRSSMVKVARINGLDERGGLICLQSLGGRSRLALILQPDQRDVVLGQLRDGRHGFDQVLDRTLQVEARQSALQSGRIQRALPMLGRDDDQRGSPQVMLLEGFEHLADGMIRRPPFSQPASASGHRPGNSI